MSIIDKIRKKLPPKAYKNRLKFLESEGRDISLISDGVEKVCSNLKNGSRSLVVYGEPQSGKTEFMIALVCRFLDEGKKTIFIIMNDNTELEVQNFNRFKKTLELNPSPLKSDQFIELEDRDKKNPDQQRIIFCRKNARNLKKLIDDARFLKDRVIIDDEADYATPDTKINKVGDASKINQLVGELGELESDFGGIYIGVTATPGRLDLNATFENNSKDWVFLDSHRDYKGREFFFPIHDKPKYILKLLPVDGDEPKHLRDAFLRFLVRTAIVNLIDESSSPRGYTMLIHTDGKKNSHREDQKQINKHLSILQRNEEDDKAQEKYWGLMEEQAKNEIKKHNLSLDSDRILGFIHEYIGKHSVLIVNDEADKANVKEVCEPINIFTFAIGGNIISRGLTFNSLLTFFFSRNVKKFQQNTYIQRARMFGVRKYSEFFELTVPKDIFIQWETCFIDHELSLISAKEGDYQHIYSKKNRSADSTSVDKERTQNLGAEHRAGDNFQMPEGIEDIFSDHAKNPNHCTETIIKLIRDLKEKKVIPKGGFYDGILSQVEKMTNVYPDMKLLMAGDNKSTFINPIGYADFDEITLERSRGGLVTSTINRRAEYNDKAIIMPIKNNSGLMRFIFMPNNGKSAKIRVN
mgnify:CR=1 FL=1